MLILPFAPKRKFEDSRWGGTQLVRGDRQLLHSAPPAALDDGACPAEEDGPPVRSSTGPMHRGSYSTPLRTPHGCPRRSAGSHSRAPAPVRGMRQRTLEERDASCPSTPRRGRPCPPRRRW